LKVPYLGSVPLDPSVSDASDRGIPSIVAHPDRPQTKAFKDIAGKLAQQASIMSLTRKDLIKPGEVQTIPKFAKPE
jgi:ATP-binding protein involved in chromosome partitioning